MEGFLSCFLEFCDYRYQGIHSRALQSGDVILLPKQSLEVGIQGCLSALPLSGCGFPC